MRSPGRVRLIYADKKKYFGPVAECKRCGDIIRSTGMHDLVNCKCNAIAVDGLTLLGNPSDVIWRDDKDDE